MKQAKRLAYDSGKVEYGSDRSRAWLELERKLLELAEDLAFKARIAPDPTAQLIAELELLYKDPTAQLITDVERILGVT